MWFFTTPLMLAEIKPMIEVVSDLIDKYSTTEFKVVILATTAKMPK